MGVVPPGQSHVPLAPQTRPAAAQSNSQQRPPWQLPLLAHWLLCVHPVDPTGIRLLHSPLAALQPFAHAVDTKVLFTQARELPPWHVGPPPSH
jgi:hypothetical protein